MAHIMVAVFNHSAARFLRGAKDGEVVEVATLVCPEAKLPARELYSDAPSKTQDSFGARHAYEPHTTAQEKLTLDFARNIADWLESARANGQFSRLVLIAPPDMLGAVRKVLSGACGKIVVEECHKNLVQKDIPEILSALQSSVKALQTKQVGMPEQL